MPNPNGRWDRAKEPELPVHRIHGYPAKFPAFIVTESLAEARSRGVKVNKVADVFCGCGTTAVEAKQHNLDFWGCDVNPVAALITRTKCGKYTGKTLERHFMNIKDCFSKTHRGGENVHERIKYWFDDEHIEELLRLRQAIYASVHKTSPYRKFFLCAFSNILKPTSRWLSKSIKPQIDPNKYPADVMDAFARQFHKMSKAYKDSMPHNLSRRGMGKQVCVGDFLRVGAPSDVDLIVTSPPYVTSYDYAALHQLSLLWLFPTHDYRELRKSMVGNHDDKLESIASMLNGSAKRTVTNLKEVDRSKANYVAKYFCDMDRAISKCWHVLHDRGMAVFVIGNTAYRGVEIDNAGHLKACMNNVGFKDIKQFTRKTSSKILTSYRDARGRFTKRGGHRDVYAKEYVLVGQR